MSLYSQNTLIKLTLLFAITTIFFACAHPITRSTAADRNISHQQKDLVQVWECVKGRCGFRYYGPQAVKLANKCGHTPSACKPATALETGINLNLDQRKPAAACTEGCCSGYIGCWSSCPTW